MHRALHRFGLSPINLISAHSLTFMASLLWLALLPRVCQFWKRALVVGLGRLPLHAEVGLSQHRVWPALVFYIPYPRFEPVLPDARTWGYTALVTLLLFAGTVWLPKMLTPVIYLLRGMLGIQASALLYFAIMPAQFPHTPAGYLEGLLTAGMGLITAVPFLFGLTYYIFDFGFLKKAFLTVITMSYLVVFLPFQILLQALILQKTVLFMPLLYMVFGLPLEVLMIVAFYSWGMTWRDRLANSSGSPTA
jgi:hypothetical protein